MMQARDPAAVVRSSVISANLHGHRKPTHQTTATSKSAKPWPTLHTAPARVQTIISYYQGCFS